MVEKQPRKIPGCSWRKNRPTPLVAFVGGCQGGLEVDGGGGDYGDGVGSGAVPVDGQKTGRTVVIWWQKYTNSGGRRLCELVVREREFGRLFECLSSYAKKKHELDFIVNIARYQLP